MGAKGVCGHSNIIMVAPVPPLRSFLHVMIHLQVPLFICATLA